MSEQPENRFKQRLLTKIKRLPNVYARKMVAGSVGGIPDLLICVHGWLIMPELKMPGSFPSALQWYNIEKINAAGGAAFPLYPEEEKDFIAWLTDLSLEI